MPSVSAKQAKLMSAISHGWDPPMKHAPSLAVAQEFHAADKQEGRYMHAAGGGKVSTGTQVWKYLQKLTEKYLKDSGPQAHHAAELYSNMGDVLNDHLRGKIPNESPYLTAEHLAPLKPGDPHIDDLVGLRKILDELFRNAPQVPEDVKLYRGMHPSTGVQPGYLSTTPSKFVAEDYTLGSPGSSVRKITLPGGTRALAPDLNPEALDINQKEIIAPRGGVLTPTDKDVLRYSQPEGYAEGGTVDDEDTPDAQGTQDPWEQDMLRTKLPPRAPAPNKSEHFLNLVSHAADRVMSTVTDDPHHSLSRVAAGLASQVSGQSPSGRAEFGRVPNLVNETKALPAGAADIGTAGTNILGALSDRIAPNAPGTTIPGALSHLRDAWQGLLDRHGGDIAPAFSRAAEEKANEQHELVNKAMGLTAPKGFMENAADAGGTMLGQLPMPMSEARTASVGVRGGLKALLRAIPEYLGPTVHPKLSHYLQGTFGGGTLGALASAESPPTQAAQEVAYGPKENFQ